MSRRLTLLAAITALVVAAAIWAVATREHATQADLGGTQMFPGLKDHLNDIGRIVVGPEGARVTIDRAPDARDAAAWTIAERGGYRANSNRVQTLLVSLADLVKLEPRTRLPERYAELGVEDPVPGGTSTPVALYDKSGALLADLIVGKGQTGLAGSVGANSYVRRPGDPQSWLVKGGLVLDREPAQWLDRELLVLVRERIMGATIVQADGSTLEVARDKPSDDTFRIANLPEGRTARTPTIAAPVANAMGYVAADDVRKADGLDFASNAVVSTWRTFDGLVLKATTIEADGKVWGRLEASVDPAQIEAAKALDKVPAADGTNLMRDEAAITKEAADLSALWNGWAYAFEATKARDLRTRLADLLAPEDKKPAAPEGAVAAPGDIPDGLPGFAVPGAPGASQPAP